MITIGVYRNPGRFGADRFNIDCPSCGKAIEGPTDQKSVNCACGVRCELSRTHIAVLTDGKRTPPPCPPTATALREFYRKSRRSA